MPAVAGLCRETPLPMKTSRLLLSVAVFATAALAGSAAFESARVLPDNPMPLYPNALKLTGVTQGRAIIAVSVDPEGRVKDQLVLAYTEPRFARASTDALRDWRFAPARFDGVPVSVQFELTFEYTLQGAVISTGINDHFMYDNYGSVGPNALAYRPARADRVDHAPVRVGGDSPKYALAAAQEGVRGVVTVRFYIDEQGNVRLPSVADPANAYLTEQAMAAVRDWKFQPVTSRGEPVLVAAQQEFNFGSRQ
jgi:TonB family protein